MTEPVTLGGDLAAVTILVRPSIPSRYGYATWGLEHVRLAYQKGD